MMGRGCVSAMAHMWWYIKKVQLQPAEQLYIKYTVYGMSDIKQE